MARHCTTDGTTTECPQATQVEKATQEENAESTPDRQLPEEPPHLEEVLAVPRNARGEKSAVTTADVNL